MVEAVVVGAVPVECARRTGPGRRVLAVASPSSSSSSTKASGGMLR